MNHTAFPFKDSPHPTVSVPEYKVKTLYSGTKVGVYILGTQCLSTAPFCACAPALVLGHQVWTWTLERRGCTLLHKECAVAWEGEGWGRFSRLTPRLSNLVYIRCNVWFVSKRTLDFLYEDAHSRRRNAENFTTFSRNRRNMNSGMSFVSWPELLSAAFGRFPVITAAPSTSLIGWGLPQKLDRIPKRPARCRIIYEWFNNWRPQ